jgi:hypothetical protein
MHMGCQWASIVNSTEEEREIYSLYMVTFNELKAVRKVTAQAGQSAVVNKTSVELMPHENNFREIKRPKRLTYNDTTETAKKLTKPVPTSTAVKLQPKAVLTHISSHLSELLTWT